MKLPVTAFLTFAILVCFASPKMKISKQIDDKLSYTLKDAGISFSLPNDNWFLSNKETADRDWFYSFKRKPILGSKGQDIIPAIVVKFADASQYKGNVKAFASDIKKEYLNNGFHIDREFDNLAKDYPINYKNSYMLKGSHSENGYDHILYMIYIINKKGMGIGIFLDMTKDITPTYESEFWTTMRSIKLTQ